MPLKLTLFSLFYTTPILFYRTNLNFHNHLSYEYTDSLCFISIKNKLVDWLSMTNCTMGRIYVAYASI
jgi:hypothetical protein